MAQLDDLKASADSAVAELERLSALVTAVEAALAAAIQAGDPAAVQAVADQLKAEVAKTSSVQ